MTIELGATTEADLDFVLACEGDPDTSPYIRGSSRAEHLELIDAADAEHLLIVEDGKPAGFALLAGLTGVDDTIEIRRIVVTQRGQGLGRRALALIVHRCFKHHGVHRVWLDAITTNERAQRAYAAVGFVREGVLRDAWRKGERRESLVVMSILAPEWEGAPGDWA